MNCSLRDPKVSTTGSTTSLASSKSGSQRRNYVRILFDVLSREWLQFVNFRFYFKALCRPLNLKCGASI